MGGRGASSSGGDGLPARFRSALGRKGKPIGYRAALDTVNKPRYNNDVAYRINCQRCVYAYEMQRRGYKVLALANWTHGADGFSNSRTGGFRHVFEGQTWEPISSYGGGRTAAGKANMLERRIKEKFDEWPGGARAIVSVDWKRSKSGHVFNVERVGGEVCIVEAQSGRRKPLSAYMSRCKPDSVQISRLDNLTKPTDNLLKCVTQHSNMLK